jgi:hypothetical protein
LWRGLSCGQFDGASTDGVGAGPAAKHRRRGSALWRAPLPPEHPARFHRGFVFRRFFERGTSEKQGRTHSRRPRPRLAPTRWHRAAHAVEASRPWSDAARLSTKKGRCSAPSHRAWLHCRAVQPPSPQPPEQREQCAARAACVSYPACAMHGLLRPANGQPATASSGPQWGCSRQSQARAEVKAAQALCCCACAACLLPAACLATHWRPATPASG